MSEFIKIGKNIVTKPQGADYDLIPGKVYDLNWDRWESRPIFSENGDLNLPKKVYELKKDKTFKERVLTCFSKTGAQTTGVMLAGTKGTGKTILAKVLATESNLPIVVVNGEYPAEKLNVFFKEFKTEVCVIFDEIEKNWNTNKMLEFLDGVQATAKKLVIMTCNSLDSVSDYMKDRCSRIRYMRIYRENDNVELISKIVNDFEISNPEVVAQFMMTRIKLLSMDNVLTFLNEIKLFDDGENTIDKLNELLEDMNISQKGNMPTKVTDASLYIKALAEIRGISESEAQTWIEKNEKGLLESTDSKPELLLSVIDDDDEDDDDGEDDPF